jgi:chorismate mutase/prephenate dehydratase
MDSDRIPFLRQSIDRIDRDILDLINRRLQYAKEIGGLKADRGAHVLDPARESTVIRRLMDLNQGPLSQTALHHIYREIIAAAREVQQPLRIAYLGPEATFTYIAAMNHFGHSATFLSQPSIRDVFREVEKGGSQFGVVPVENSIEGAVNHTLDLFFESKLQICAEIYHSISHDLLTKCPTLDAIKTVYSHPHAFGQCRSWMRRHLPACRKIECSSTAEAAKKAAQYPLSAAIASREAAHMYELDVLGEHIEDFAHNVTRFLVIGPGESRPTGRDKTSIMFATTHVPGALHHALKPLADHGINMVKLESRPSKHENWSYFFFVDIDGHLDDPPLAKAIELMQDHCLYLKILGSYPQTHSQE